MSIRLIGVYTSQMREIEANEMLDLFEALVMSQAADQTARRDYVRKLTKDAKRTPRVIKGLDAVASYLETIPRGR